MLRIDNRNCVYSVININDVMCVLKSLFIISFIKFKIEKCYILY